MPRVQAGLKLLSLEVLLKGGFFVAGLILYFSDRVVFSNFIYLNSVFTLIYNVSAYGIPYLYARELHKSGDFSLSGLAPLCLLSISTVLAFVCLLPGHALVAIAAGVMVISDLFYSKYRIARSGPVFWALFASGSALFVSNVLSGIVAEVHIRYIGIVLSSIAFLPLFFTLSTQRFSLDGDRGLVRRLFGDGVSFSATHALFWLRNGLDKVILFPLLSSVDYANYGAAFFVLSVFQTILTSFLRVCQRWLFDLAESSFQGVRRMHAGSLVFVVAGIAIVIWLDANYIWMVAVGGAVHLLNQVIVMFLNYRRPVAIYTAANFATSAVFALCLFAIGPSVKLFSYLFCLSNVLLSFIYLVVLSDRFWWARRSLGK